MKKKVEHQLKEQLLNDHRRQESLKEALQKAFHAGALDVSDKIINNEIWPRFEDQIFQNCVNAKLPAYNIHQTIVLGNRVASFRAQTQDLKDDDLHIQNLDDGEEPLPSKRDGLGTGLPAMKQKKKKKLTVKIGKRNLSLNGESPTSAARRKTFARAASKMVTQFLHGKGQQEFISDPVPLPKQKPPVLDLEFEEKLSAMRQVMSRRPDKEVASKNQPKKKRFGSLRHTLSMIGSSQLGDKTDVSSPRKFQSSTTQGATTSKQSQSRSLPKGQTFEGGVYLKVRNVAMETLPTTSGNFVKFVRSSLGKVDRGVARSGTAIKQRKAEAQLQFAPNTNLLNVQSPMGSHRITPGKPSETPLSDSQRSSRPAQKSVTAMTAMKSQEGSPTPAEQQVLSKTSMKDESTSPIELSHRGGTRIMAFNRNQVNLQQQPIRQFLRPNFGVTYTEGPDPSRSLGPIRMKGASVYEAPRFKSRMRKEDLKRRQASEKKDMIKNKFKEEENQLIDSDQGEPHKAPGTEQIKKEEDELQKIESGSIDGKHPHFISLHVEGSKGSDRPIPFIGSRRGATPMQKTSVFAPKTPGGGTLNFPSLDTEMDQPSRKYGGARAIVGSRFGIRNMSQRNGRISGSSQIDDKQNQTVETPFMKLGADTTSLIRDNLKVLNDKAPSHLLQEETNSRQQNLRSRMSQRLSSYQNSDAASSIALYSYAPTQTATPYKPGLVAGIKHRYKVGAAAPKAETSDSISFMLPKRNSGLRPVSNTVFLSGHSDQDARVAILRQEMHKMGEKDWSRRMKESIISTHRDETTASRPRNRTSHDSS